MGITAIVGYGAKWCKEQGVELIPLVGVLRSMYVGAEISELRGGVRRSWGVDGTADVRWRSREEADRFGNGDGEGR